jgi:hypothetical protein
VPELEANAHRGKVPRYTAPRYLRESILGVRRILTRSVILISAALGMRLSDDFLPQRYKLLDW